MSEVILGNVVYGGFILGMFVRDCLKLRKSS